MNFFFFKQKTAYEMRISDWSSDVCSSDLLDLGQVLFQVLFLGIEEAVLRRAAVGVAVAARHRPVVPAPTVHPGPLPLQADLAVHRLEVVHEAEQHVGRAGRLGQSLPEDPLRQPDLHVARADEAPGRSEEHTSELQSLMRISYAVFCLQKKKIKK